MPPGTFGRYLFEEAWTLHSRLRGRSASEAARSPAPGRTHSAALGELEGRVGTPWVAVTEERTGTERPQRGEPAGWRSGPEDPRGASAAAPHLPQTLVVRARLLPRSLPSRDLRRLTSFQKDTAPVLCPVQPVCTHSSFQANCISVCPLKILAWIPSALRIKSKLSTNRAPSPL